MGSVWRNREFRRCILAMAAAGAALLPVCWWLHPWAGAAAGVLWLVVAGLHCLFTRRRYRQIGELAERLAKIAEGNDRVDIAACGEGELGILSSELLKITAALSHQAENLQRDKRYLADSLADISHQLKTPLTSMSVMVDLLDMPAVPQEKRREFLDGLHTSIQRTQWLVSSLLKLSRLDAGAVAFRREPLGLSQVVDQAAAPLRIPMELKGQTLVLQVEETATGEGDGPWLTEAVGNLLKNCMEHTPPGGVIRVQGFQNPLYAQICVSDNGPGIPPEDLPRIFERFYRGRNACSDSVGIGLALSKSIVQNLGGTLTAENLPQGGACFTIKLYGKTVV